LGACSYVKFTVTASFFFWIIHSTNLHAVTQASPTLNIFLLFTFEFLITSNQLRHLHRHYPIINY
jgi:hypothetical protein